jgi:hypothetical protein
VLKFSSGGDEVTEQFQRLLNGDAASGSSNPINDELGRVQEEINTITEQFKSEVDKIRREGLKYILGDAMDENADLHAEMPKDDDKDDSTAWNPEVSILPIDDPDSAEQILQGGAAFIGKGKEQVQQAFEMAKDAVTPEKKTTSHEEL